MIWKYGKEKSRSMYNLSVQILGLLYVSLGPSQTVYRLKSDSRYLILHTVNLNTIRSYILVERSAQISILINDVKIFIFQNNMRWWWRRIKSESKQGLLSFFNLPRLLNLLLWRVHQVPLWGLQLPRMQRLYAIC